MRTLLAALAVLVLAGSACAEPPRRVLCYGDSITLYWPALLQGMRPDLEVHGAGLSGDTTANVDRLRSSLETGGPYTTVVLLLGINDPLDGSVSDPLVSFRRPRVLARLAQANGADVILLTLLPESRIRPPRPDFDFNGFARDLSRLILARYGHGGRIRAGDLRDAFGVPGLDATSDDGLHPNAAGNEVIARFVSGLLP